LLTDPIVIVGCSPPTRRMGCLPKALRYGLAASDPRGPSPFRMPSSARACDPTTVESHGWFCCGLFPRGQGQAPRSAGACKSRPGLAVCAPSARRVAHMCGFGHGGVISRMMLGDRSQKTSSWPVAGSPLSNAPFDMPKARAASRMGHQTVYDHMFLAGLEGCLYNRLLIMAASPRCVRPSSISALKPQDDFAREAISSTGSNNDGTLA